jgi:hypothetical protein
MAKTAVLLGTQDAAADAYSVSLDLGDLQCGSFLVGFSGGAGNLAGTLYLQGSVDNVIFFDYPNADQAVTASTGHIWDLNPTGVRYFRVFWDYTSGTGNITVTSYLKEAK